ncbi:hypothetical protein [Aeromicrobium endophyticum]|uniref:Uncharacterized protein n=1 Tax=Aeromicrobium endophyticum TaxID=2292704 RepID=A0A371PDT7_9ACTN|nr:hypothetical protein [Aeromicrobium endophyticum]REK73678.1 hypothetical protein DX116_09140 [Aeromicrobium endophyticum]
MTGLTVTASELRSVVEPVIGLVDAGSAVYALTGVRLRTEEAYLIAEGAGQFALGQCRQIIDQPGELDVLLPLDALQQVMREVAVAADRRPLVDFRVESPGRLTVVVRSRPDVNAAAFAFELMDHTQFPDLAKPFLKAIQSPASHRTAAALTLAQLDAFRAVEHPLSNPDDYPLVILPGQRRADPVLVTCGHHFIGLVTPRQELRPGTRHRRAAVMARDLDGWGALLS